MYETLKREMLDLKLEPGRMLSENEICERFGVSRTPVREHASAAGAGICGECAL